MNICSYVYFVKYVYVNCSILLLIKIFKVLCNSIYTVFYKKIHTSMLFSCMNCVDLLLWVYIRFYQSDTYTQYLKYELFNSD